VKSLSLPERQSILGIEISSGTQADAIDTIMGWCRDGRKEFVVTPNLDHVLKLETSEPFRAAYRNAQLVLADGWPLVAMGKVLGRPVSRITGSDLINPLCAAAAAQGHSVFLFGTTFDALRESARTLAGRYPALNIAGIYSPPRGFDQDNAEADTIVELINSVEPAIILVALGAPRQEIWADTMRDRLACNALVCIGGGLDFISGKVPRAPKLWQKFGIEWLWRAVSEPRRLGLRYLNIILRLPMIMLRQAFSRKQGQLTSRRG